MTTINTFEYIPIKILEGACVCLRAKWAPSSFEYNNGDGTLFAKSDQTVKLC